jgi:hypothetical protein
MTDKPIFVKYVGAGAFTQGVPSCDMTESEWKALAEEQRQMALESGTHKLLKSGAKQPAAEVTNGSAS